jgi:hypothetical protein
MELNAESDFDWRTNCVGVHVAKLKASGHNTGVAPFIETAYAARFH